MPKATSTAPNRSDTTADRKLKSAERKAAKLIADAEREAERIRAEADERARGVVVDARATAEGVRAEGMELVSNLREMGDVLRANADRLLRDIQSIHSRMVGELDRVDPGGGMDDAAQAPPAPAGDEVLDVPDFIPRG